MSTLVEEPATRTSDQNSPARQLQTRMAAMRLSFTWFGVRKTLSAEQKARAAESFGAEGDSLSAGKKLLDVRHPRYRAVTQVRGRAIQYWKAMSLPFPEAGIRLIRQDDVTAITVQMTSIQAELDEAAEQLNRHYGELKNAARNRLGRLFNEADYPGSLSGLFEMSWDFPSVEPPEYLRRLSPELYRQECQRVTARFDEAVQLAEATFTEELSKLVEHLSERLSGNQDGKPKVFRDSAIENMREFFQRFQRLNIRSSDQLDEVVEQARGVISGVQPQQLRDNTLLRQQVAEQIGEVRSSLDALLVDRPRRNILRRPR